MNYMKAILFGGVAGLVAAGVWAAAVYYTGYEVGWIAWGIGGVVGFAVRHATEPAVTYTGDDAADAMQEIAAGSDQIGPGVIAATIALASVLIGKYLAVTLLIGNLSAADLDEELLVSYIADEVVAEYVAEGRSVSWPDGVDPQYAAAQADYPADAWTEATRRWREMSPQDRAEFTADTTAMVSEMMDQNATGALLATFSPIDLLWFGLAAWTAFKIGAGGGDDD